MNCKQIQQEILDRLAAGESVLPWELLAHQHSCSLCRRYFESQLALFRSMEQGLGVIANSPVPPSLLPVVRARLDEQATARPFRFFDWPMAALTASALVAVALMLFWYRPRPVQPAAEVAYTATPKQSDITQNSTAPIPPEVPVTTRKTLHHLGKPHERSTALVAAEAPTLEVVVLAEEREAFSRFIAQVPENPAVVLALTHPAPQAGESPVEIASLKIDILEVKPLESSE